MKAFYRNILFLLTIPLVFSACATGQVQHASEAVIITGVPFYPQEQYQCGPASLAGVLRYWGLRREPEDIAREIYSKGARGTLNMDLVLYASKEGLDARQYSGGWDDLKQKITDGAPLIVLVDFGFSAFQANHFMVVTGYSDDGVVVNSGKEEGLFMDKKKFQKAWQRTNFWTLWIQRK